jgi:hypothetical protein
LPPEIVSPQETDSGPGADFGPDLFPPSHLVSTTVCSTLESLLYFTLETLAGIPVATAIPFIRSGLYLYFLFNMPSRHRPRIPSFMSDRAKPQTLNTFPISHQTHVHHLSSGLGKVEIAVNLGFDYRIKKHWAWNLTLYLRTCFKSFNMVRAISAALRILKEVGTLSLLKTLRCRHSSFQILADFPQRNIVLDSSTHIDTVHSKHTVFLPLQ